MQSRVRKILPEKMPGRRLASEYVPSYGKRARWLAWWFHMAAPGIIWAYTWHKDTGSSSQVIFKVLRLLEHLWPKIRQVVNGKLLDKSMSPISHPSARGHVDILVRSYGGPPKSEGLGAFLCDMSPGEKVDIIKPGNFWFSVDRWSCGTYLLRYRGGPMLSDRP